MRGGYLHSQILARGLRIALEHLGAEVWTEYPAGPGRRAGAVDLYAEREGVRVAFEVELGPRRVVQDLRKAEALGVDVLVIVTPTAGIAAIVRRRLRTQGRSRVRVRVQPFGSALAHLSQVFPAESARDKKSEAGRRTSGRTDGRGQAG